MHEFRFLLRRAVKISAAAADNFGWLGGALSVFRRRRRRMIPAGGAGVIRRLRGLYWTQSVLQDWLHSWPTEHAKSLSSCHLVGFKRNYALHFCNFTHCIGLLCDLLLQSDRCCLSPFWFGSKLCVAVLLSPLWPVACLVKGARSPTSRVFVRYIFVVSMCRQNGDHLWYGDWLEEGPQSDPKYSATSSITKKRGECLSLFDHWVSRDINTQACELVYCTSRAGTCLFMQSFCSLVPFSGAHLL